MARVQKKYAIIKGTITELLDEVDAFVSKTEQYMEKHPEFKYDIQIDEQSDGWRAIVNFERDE